MNIPFSFWKTASPIRKRIYSIIFILALCITATILGTLVQLSAQDAKQLSDSTNGIITDNPTYPSLVGAILLNNFKICLVMFIPILGAVFGLFVLFTGAPFLDRRTTTAGTSGRRIDPAGGAGCRTGKNQRFIRHQHVVALQIDAAAGA